MAGYMEEHFGPYTIEDLTQGENALAGGSVGVGSRLVLAEAHGATIADPQGNEYIDCTSQAWSLNVGGTRPEVMAAAGEQMQHLTHARSLYGTIPKYLLTKRLVDIAPGRLKKVSYCLHGSVANEAAMKLAMRNRPRGIYFMSPWRSFLGRTLATMALSWPHPNPALLPFQGHVVRFPQAYCYRCPFQAKYPGCGLQCADFVRKMIIDAVDGEPIALIMEPFQAAGGMIDYPPGYLQAIREICDEFDILLIWDEIQTAFGRMGAMFASDLYGVVPDILTFGKAIGGGFPLAGTLHREDLEDFAPQDHGFTFAHFPVSMAAALVTLRILQEEDLPGRAAQIGAAILARLNDMKEKYPLIGDVRGAGLMIGVELVRDRSTKEPATEETARFVEEGLKRGVLFGKSTYTPMTNVIKLKPPLVITEEQVERVLGVFEEIVVQLSDS